MPHESLKTATGAPFTVLVSVTDKSGLCLLKPLAERGARFVSTGGTARALRETHGIDCIDVSVVTGFPEILDGRVKVLHPNIFGGLLADQRNPTHMQTLKELGIGLFDAVFVNLYDFAGNPRVSEIDVGGPSALRAAAKAGLTVVTDVSDYEEVVAEICDRGGWVSSGKRLQLIAKVFDYTSKYDAAICEWVEGQIIEGKDPFAEMVSPH
ncbi:MAG TPA: IMP cyclohydrolase [Candidatus Paceibacterota bacterium]